MSDKYRTTITNLLVLLLFIIILVASLARQARRIEQDMDELVNGHFTCLVDTSRTTECELEYDGDGSSALPGDWHWYWK